MNKQEFLRTIALKMHGLPQNDINQSIDYYEEMIDDRIEEGLSEEQAVEALGNVDDIVAQILMDTPLPKLVKSRVKPKTELKSWQILLIVLGFPLWFPILLSVAILLLSVYIVLWSVVISLYAVNFSVAAVALASLAVFGVSIFTGNYSQAIFILGAALVCAGIAIMLFLLFGEITKAVILLTKIIFRSIKKSFIRKVDINE